MHFVNKRFAIILLVSLGLMAISIQFYLIWQKFISTDVVKSGQSIHYILPPGGTIKSIAKILHKKGNLSHPSYLVWYVKLKGLTKNLKAGEYQFKGPLTVNGILNKVITGDVVQHEITFVEGWTLKEVIAKLNETTSMKHELDTLTKKELLLKLELDHKHLEGLFFPDTYNFTYGTSDIELLKRAHIIMKHLLQQQWKNRAANLPYKTAYQALIVASLIEKETALQSEQPLIAGVIVNRLRKHMYLQIDPTVIYGLGNEFNGVITTKDLRAKNPYNTYVVKGLPPSPICLPGKSAIHAALHPDKTKFLYFVAKGDGSHIFSISLKAHDQAIKKYILNDPEGSNLHENNES